MPVQVGWRRRTLNQGNGRGRALVVGLEGGQDHARIAERRGALSPGGSRTGGCSDGHEWVQGGRTGCYLGLAAVLLNMFVEQTGREEGGNVFFSLSARQDANQRQWLSRWDRTREAEDAGRLGLIFIMSA